jgi:hypothetical protein
MRDRFFAGSRSSARLLEAPAAALQKTDERIPERVPSTGNPEPILILALVLRQGAARRVDRGLCVGIDQVLRTPSDVGTTA